MKRWMFTGSAAIILVQSIYAVAWGAAEGESKTDEEQVKVEASAEDRLFLDALEGVFPLDPDKIGTLRSRQNRVEEAATKTPVAKILSESRPLLLEPGKVSAPVVLTPGYVGAIVFCDVTGAPWPISRAVLGNDSLFSLVGGSRVDAGDEQKEQDYGDAHILYITPTREHANSNILVHLQDATSPVIVQLVSAPSTQNGRKHDGIVTFLVSARGPKAKALVFDGVSPTISETMMTILDGVPPAGASSLEINPSVPGLRLWRIGQHFFLRSPYSLTWPAYKAYAETTGYYVYEMPNVPSFIVSKDGQPLSITIEE